MICWTAMVQSLPKILLRNVWLASSALIQNPPSCSNRRFHLSQSERLNLQPTSLWALLKSNLALLEFNRACNDCLSILLPHASHYSKELINLLLSQQWKPLPLLEISVKPTMVRPYLEVMFLSLDQHSNQLMLCWQQFENHIDATPELKAFFGENWVPKGPLPRPMMGSLGGFSNSLRNVLQNQGDQLRNLGNT